MPPRLRTVQESLTHQEHATESLFKNISSTEKEIEEIMGTIQYIAQIEYLERKITKWKTIAILSIIQLATLYLLFIYAFIKTL